MKKVVSLKEIKHHIDSNITSLVLDVRYILLDGDFKDYPENNPEVQQKFRKLRASMWSTIITILEVSNVEIEELKNVKLSSDKTSVAMENE